MRIILLMSLLMLLSLNLSGYGTNIEYNNRNQVSIVAYSNGYTIAYNYDTHGNIINQTITTPNATPLSPTQFNLVSNGISVTLTWETVTNSVGGSPIIVSYYRIEASESPYSGFTVIGSTSQTQFTDTNNSLQKRFYRIIAVVNPSRSDIVQEEPQFDSPGNDK